MINADIFLQKIRIPLEQQWGYIYGTRGQTWTQKLQVEYSKSTHTNWKKTRAYGSQWIGRRVTDCSGLIFWACKQLGENVAHHSHYLYTDYCRNKGKLNNGLRADGTQPRPGSLVFLVNAQGRKHHVGVYCGNNVVIEAKGTQWGVVTSELSHWDAWGELKCIDYNNNSDNILQPDNATQQARTINPGSYLNLRNGPDTEYQSIARIPKGATVIIINKFNKEWWQIKYNNITGYVMRQYLQEL